jgi:hypothetical protein
VSRVASHEAACATGAIRALVAVLLAIVAPMLLAVPASAGQYPARGDTGWVYAGKRDCCNAAIAMAQEYSAATCRNVGGTPSPMRGGVQRRGFCAWESASDASGAVLFRCQAEASVPCR